MRWGPKERANAHTRECKAGRKDTGLGGDRERKRENEKTTRGLIIPMRKIASERAARAQVFIRR